MRYLDVPYAKYRKLRRLVLARDPQCVYCGAKATTADHVQPLSQGGESKLDNLVGACASCNYSKGARPSTRMIRRKSTSAQGKSVSYEGTGHLGPVEGLKLSPNKGILTQTNANKSKWTLSPKKRTKGSNENGST